jgi:microcystin-dependent protein
MNKEDMIKIGIAAFVVIILIVVVVIVMRKKKDNYQYPSGKLYVQPSTDPGARVSGNGGPTIPSSTLAALVADTNGNINTTAAVPIGAIIMWAGSVASIPTGWGLCDGTVHGTITSPDLTGRFVVGAGQSSTASTFTTQYGVGDMGGEEFHQLTGPEMPYHTHNTNLGNQPCSGTGCSANNGINIAQYGNSWWYTAGEGGDSTNKDAKGNPLTLPHNNMPPYYALAYIIKWA